MLVDLFSISNSKLFNMLIDVQLLHCFVQGDGRINEQAGLTTVHIIFIRTHNVFEERLHQLNPQWDGERLYQETRKIIGK